MAIPDLADKHEVLVEVEWVYGSGTYSGWCGSEDFSVNRATETESVQVSNCADRSGPKKEIVKVKGKSVSMSGSGNWSKQTSSNVLIWYNSGEGKNVRVRHAKATIGEVEYETGFAILEKLDTAGIFSGPTITEEIGLKISNYDVVIKA